MTRLVLVSLQDWYPPLGLGYIASYLAQYAGFSNTQIIQGDSLDGILTTIKKASPDIVGISSVTPDFETASLLAEDIKRSLDIPVLVGGHHVTALPHMLPRVFDVGVMGEGEQTMLELIELYESEGLETFRLRNVAGIVFHESGKTRATDRSKLIEPLDRIPFPARDLFDMDLFLRPRTVFGTFGCRVSYMSTSRGCPYDCLYCSATRFWGTRQRFFTPGYVLAEIKELIDKYKAEVIFFQDDLWVSNLKRVEEIVELVEDSKINEMVEFGCFVRANLVNDKMCKLLRRMNVTGVTMGLESMSEGVLGYLKGGSVSVEQNRLAIDLFNKYGIRAEPTFMVGSPGESFEDIQETLRFIEDSDLRDFNIYATKPLPGTDLWQYAKKIGAVRDDMDWSRLRIEDNIFQAHNEVFLVADKLRPEELLSVIAISRKMLRRARARHMRVRHIGRVLRYLLSHPKVFVLPVCRRIYHEITDTLDGFPSSEH